MSTEITIPAELKTPEIEEEEEGQTELPVGEEPEEIEDAAEAEEEQEEEEVEEDLFNKNTASFRCLAQILISRSSLLRHPLYHFPPLVDPGLDEAFNYVEPLPVIDNTGCEEYLRMCKEMGIVPITRVLRSLPTTTLNLKYYGLTTKQIKAITEALMTNDFVTEIILQDNWLTPQAIQYISELLEDDNILEYLNLQECRIKAEGASKLVQGLSNTYSLRELDLSFNSLGDEGLLVLEPGLMDNMSIVTLNLSHNDLGDDAAQVLARLFIRNNYIEDLDLSWNNFYTGTGNKILFAALSENEAIKSLNIAWNGIGTREAVIPITKYMKKTEILEHLDISNNRLTDKPLRMIRSGISKCVALISIKIGNNLITPEEALFVAKVFNAAPENALQYLDMENTFVNKDFVPLWKRLTNKGKSINIGGILGNYVIRGPDTVKLLFDRAKFLAMKAKKKKAKKDFGYNQTLPFDLREYIAWNAYGYPHFILQMPEQKVSKQEFQALVKKFKMKKFQKDTDLVTEITNRFPAKKQKIDLPAMKESYMNYYPDTVLPPPKKKKGKGKKGKKKKGEALKAEPTATGEVVESQPVTEKIPSKQSITKQPSIEKHPAVVKEEQVAETQEPSEYSAVPVVTEEPVTETQEPPEYSEIPPDEQYEKQRKDLGEEEQEELELTQNEAEEETIQQSVENT